MGLVARLHGRHDIRLHDEPRPVPDASRGEVLLRITAVGLCGSDLHWYEHGSIGESVMQTPFVPGHELAGVIEDGPRHGERVAIDPADACGRCDLCLGGRGRLCPAMRFAGLAPTDGGLRQWIAWPAIRCHTLPPSIGDPVGALLEPLGVALHAVDLAGTRPDMTAGVYGLGPIGLSVVAALRAAGVTRIVASDLLAHRVAASRGMGASEALRATGRRTDPAASVPVDVAFECAGTNPALRTAIRAVRPGGRVILVGIPGRDRTTFVASEARRKELALLLCRRMEDRDLARAIDLVAAGDVTLDRMVTDRYPLAQAPAAFEALASRRGNKVVVQPWGIV
jgi:L-iditol 2-dehydrogenase